MIHNLEEVSNSPATRVAIAKDALELLKARRITATHGNYCELGFKPNPEEEFNIQFQSFAKSNTRCEVCALGSMFISAVNKFNQFKTPCSSFGQESVKRYLLKFFTIEQMESIEIAHEGYGFTGIRNVFVSLNIVTVKFPKELEFHEKYYNDDEGRIVAILENIIANNGEFKP